MVHLALGVRTTYQWKVTSGCHGDLGRQKVLLSSKSVAVKRKGTLRSPPYNIKFWLLEKQNQNVTGVLSVGELVTYCATIVGVV